MVRKGRLVRISTMALSWEESSKRDEKGKEGAISFDASFCSRSVVLNRDRLTCEDPLSSRRRDQAQVCGSSLNDLIRIEETSDNLVDVRRAVDGSEGSSPVLIFETSKLRRT